jgi:hypothetical protein
VKTGQVIVMVELAENDTHKGKKCFKHLKMFSIDWNKFKFCFSTKREEFGYGNVLHSFFGKALFF